MMKTKRTGILAFLMSAVLLLVCAPLRVNTAAADVNKTAVTVTKTEIRADEVFNTNGYASLRREGESRFGISGEEYRLPQAALADRGGNLLFPYKETYSRYYYGNGIVSLVGDSPYTIIFDRYGEYEKPRFFKLSGEEAFSCDCFGATPMLYGYSFIVGNWENNDGIVPCYLIDQTGETVYTFGGDFVQGTGIGWGMDPDCERIGASAQADWYGDGLLLCWKNLPRDNSAMKYSCVHFYMNEKGETVFTLPEEYQAASSFCEGLAKVGRADENGAYAYGFVNKEGKIVISPQYEDAGWFMDGLAHVKMNGKWGYIDKNGKTAIPFEYDDACGAGDGLASVAKNGKYGLVDYENNVVVPPEYDKISCFVGGVAYGVKDGTLYIITDCRQEISGSVKASELPSDRTIALTGDTVLTLDTDKTAKTIMPNGHALTVEGDAVLSCDFGSPFRHESSGNGTLTINSGTVRSELINLGDGTLNVCGGLLDTAPDDSETYILKANALNVSDGNVRIKGGYVSFTEVSVSGGSLEFVPSDSEDRMPYCLYSSLLNVSGGNVRIKGEGWELVPAVVVVNVSGGVLDVENGAHGLTALSVNVSGGKLRGVGNAIGIDNSDGTRMYGDGTDVFDEEGTTWLDVLKAFGDYHPGLYVTGGEVEAISAKGSCGCYMPTISVTGGRLTAGGDLSALESQNKIIVGEGMRISAPEGGYATDEITLEWETNGFKRSWTGYVICNADGSAAAETVIEPVPAAIDAENAKEIDLNLFTAPGVTAAELLALAEDGAAIAKTDGSALTAKEKIGSGMTLTKPDGTKLTVIVKGDNDGDGDISAADARLALRQAVGLERFNDWQLAASLVGGGAEITAAEARMILRAAVGLEELPLV